MRELNEHSLRLIGDRLADEVFAYLKENPLEAQRFHKAETNADLNSGTWSGPLDIIQNQFKLPAWANDDLLENGASVFRKYAQEIMAILGLYSLPYCYAGAKGVQVLYHSRRIREQPAKRLIETAQFVFDVCDFNAFAAGGRGFTSILKVRIMHAAARYYVRTHIKEEEPVNQEDQIGTLMAFSIIVLRGLNKMGIDLSRKEREAYFHLWQVVGCILGIREEYLPENIRQASRLERVIRKKEFKYSKEAEELTQVLVNYIETQSPPGFGPSQLMAFFLGDQINACLGLKELSTIEKGIISSGSRLKNGLKGFSESHYSGLIKGFESSCKKENFKPEFKITY